MKTYYSECLTGKTSYREGFFGGLIMTVEVQVLAAHVRSYLELNPYPIAPPRGMDAHSPETVKEHYAKERTRIAAHTTVIRTFYRDAKKSDMVFLEQLKNKGQENADQ